MTSDKLHRMGVVVMVVEDAVVERFITLSLASAGAAPRSKLIAVTINKYNSLSTVVVLMGLIGTAVVDVVVLVAAATATLDRATNSFRPRRAIVVCPQNVLQMMRSVSLRCCTEMFKSIIN